MCGADIQQDTLFSTVIPEHRVPADDPLHPIREMINTALKELDEDFNALYWDLGRDSIPPEAAAGATADGVLHDSQRALFNQNYSADQAMSDLEKLMHEAPPLELTHGPHSPRFIELQKPISVQERLVHVKRDGSPIFDLLWHPEGHPARGMSCAPGLPC